MLTKRFYQLFQCVAYRHFLRGGDENPYPGGRRSFEIYGREGVLSVGVAASQGGEANPSIYHGPNQLLGARGNEPLAPLPTPARFTLIPDTVPAGPPRNVAMAYTRLARAMAEGKPYVPGFGEAVRAHQLLAAVETSAASGQATCVYGG